MKLFEEMTKEERATYLKQMRDNMAKQNLVPDGHNYWYYGLTEQDWLDIIKTGTIVDVGEPVYIGADPIKLEPIELQPDPNIKGWTIRYSLMARIKHFFWGLFQ